MQDSGPRRPFRSAVESGSRVFGRLLPLCASALFLGFAARFAPDPGEGAHLRWLLAAGGGVLAPLALLVGDRWPFLLAQLGWVLAVFGPPQVSVLRLAGGTALLALALLVASREWWRMGSARSPWGWYCLPWAAQWLVASDLLHLAPDRLQTWIELGLLPVAAGALLRPIATGPEASPRLAAAASLLAFSSGPGWTPLGLAGLFLVLLLARWGSSPLLRSGSVLLAGLGHLQGGEPFWVVASLLALSLAMQAPLRLVGRCAGAFLAAWVAVAGAAATLPWKRERPFEKMLTTASSPPARIDRLLEGEARVLTDESPELRFRLEGETVRALELESYLVDAVGLPCGTIVLEGVLSDLSGGRTVFPMLLVGDNAAEWAASRPDVAARLACPPPEAWSSWIPSSGAYLGHHFQARIRLPEGLRASELLLRRPQELPEGVAIALFGVRSER